MRDWHFHIDIKHNINFNFIHTLDVLISSIYRTYLRIDCHVEHCNKKMASGTYMYKQQ
jgi:hypothetical protein